MFAFAWIFFRSLLFGFNSTTTYGMIFNLHSAIFILLFHFMFALCF